MALEFDGSSQYINVTQTKDLPIYNKVTYSVCGWIKAPDGQVNKRCFSEGNSSATISIGGPLFTIGSGQENKLQMYIRNDANNELLFTYSTTTVYDNTWHHFCWVDNNGTASLYIDGVLDATNFNYTRSGTFTLNTTSIGAIVRAAVSHWIEGELFDFRCYSRCLSANEIAEIYHKRGSDKVWQGLVGWWRMDEKTSTQTASGTSTILDLSGNGNHGTPYNSPVYRESPHRLRRGVIIT